MSVRDKFEARLPRSGPSASSLAGSLDHGLLLGLTGDDHVHYALADKSRPAVWVAAADLAPRSLADLGTRAHALLTSLNADDHAQYLLNSGRAGTANNPTLSTNASGILTGSGASGFNAVVRSNAVQDGLIVLGDDLTKNERVVIHGTEADITVGGVLLTSHLSVHDEGTIGHANFLAHKHTNTGATGPTMMLARTRGTEGAETVVADNDILGRILALGYDGTDFERAAQVLFEVDDPTPGSTSMGGAIVLSTTPAGSTALTERVRVASSGLVQITGILDIANTGTVGELRLREPLADGTNYSAFKAQAQTADLTYTLPAAITTDGFLKTNGTGTLTWSTLANADIPNLTSAQWASHVTDETGTGAWVFGTAPTFTTSIMTPVVYGGPAASDNLDLFANDEAFAGANTGRVRMFERLVLLGEAITSNHSNAAITVGNAAAWTITDGSVPSALTFNPAMTWNTTAPGFGLMPSVLSGGPTFTLDVTGSINAAALFYSGPTYVAATGRTVTLVDTGGLASFTDAPIFNRAGTGAYDASAVYNGFLSKFTVGSGVVINRRRGFRVIDGGGAGTLNHQVGIQIDALTKGGTSNIGFQNASTEVNVPTVGTIAAVGSTIPHTARVIRLDNTSGGALTLTSAPTITDGTDGELLTIFNGSTNGVTIQDQGTLASSNLRLSTTTFAIGTRDSITLMYSSTVGDWIELARTNVL
jgi:hypothetical protein